MATDRNGLPIEPDEFDNAIPRTIVCPDCGGVAHLITYIEDNAEVTADQVLAYRCSDCLDRWDVIWEESEPDS